MKIYTIKDIAKLANVGVSTVSRVLNERPDVNTDTRNKVLAIMDVYNFVPNANAKHLKQLTTEIICLIVKGHANLFFSGIIESIQRYIEDKGYTPIINYIEEHEDEILAAKKIYIERKVKGIIFLGGNLYTAEAELKKFKIPCVLSTSSISDMTLPNVSSVCVDDRRAGKMAIDYLISMGHRKIGVISGHRDRFNNVWNRFMGVKDSFSDHGLAFNEDYFIECNFSIPMAYAKVKEFFQTNNNSEITAIFATSDMMAIGAAKAITDLGMVIPKDMSLVGFDGIEMAHYYNPTITTIVQPSEEIAKVSVDLIVENMLNPQISKHIALPVTLSEGSSVAKVSLSPIGC